MRLDKPIGIFLLLWPTLWALWLASNGRPDFNIVCIFIVGVVLMRSAGCVLNDIADRNFDGFVERTRMRPLAAGDVSLFSACVLAGCLLLLAFLLVLLCNRYTTGLALVGAGLAAIYPLLKRVTHFPQLGLGLAFSWGIPMAFAAQNNEIGLPGWFLFITGLIWPVIYDTMYGMVDRDDDLKIGVKSTAILFSSMDKMVIGLLQVLFVAMLIIVGLMFKLHIIYYLSLLVVAGLFSFQQWLIHSTDKMNFHRAFLNNNLVGLVIFLGIFMSYLT